ncbi:MAG TPA: beta-ketoacyl-ACP synthase 3 [Solirubrobacteraceae bacterium]|nr:beta-ketoacyl-ACP synthase 3 [Solirubrobacteraceae bacterium]
MSATLERRERGETGGTLVGAGIVGLGSALPPRIVPNAEITPAIGVDDDWIVRRTGIRERRYAEPGAALHELAAAAGAAALADATLAPASVDLVVVASCSQDSVMPNAAPQVAHALGAGGAGAFDIGSACTGFLAALAAVRGMLASGASRNALVIGAEIMSRHVDPNDRNTAALFGDGAAAIVVTAGAPGSLGPVVLGSDGAHAQLIVADRDSGLMAMDGHETFKQAVRRMGEASAAACQAAGVALADVDLYIYHQANTRILASLAERLALDPAKVVDCIATLGNTSAASVPLALAGARADGRLRPGMRVLLAAAGSGFTWGASVIEWGLAA